MAMLLPDRIDIAAFGAFLRDARERRGLTLQQIANETRIPWRHLDALEHGNLDAVPAGMYRRAEIRAYADAVGLDRTLALSQFEQAMETAAGPPTVSSSDPVRLDIVRLRTIATTVGALTAIVGATVLAVSLMGERKQSRASTPAAGSPALSRAVANASAPQPVPDATPARHVVEEPLPGAAEVPESIAPPAVAASAHIALTISTDPPGARVLVNGIGRGVTPLTIDNLAPGQVQVRVVKDGFVSQEQNVRLGAAASHGVHLTLDAVH